MVSKRKRNVLILERKLDIIAQVRKGKLQRAVAKLFDAAKSTVGDIWKNREKIERHPPVLIPRSLRSAVSCETCISTSLTKLLVKNWMTTAGRKRSNSLTQTEITSFFRPITS